MSQIQLTLVIGKLPEMETMIRKTTTKKEKLKKKLKNSKINCLFRSIYLKGINSAKL